MISNVRVNEQLPPRVSVLMPVYNTEKYLPDAIESVLDQTFRDFVFLILDDGSTDGSLTILEKYAAKDPRIRLRSRENRGVSATRAEILGLVQSELYCSMDSDDVSACDRLEKLVSTMQRDPSLVAVGSSVELIDPEGWPIRKWHVPTAHDVIDSRHMRGDPMAMVFASCIFRTAAVRSVGGFACHLEVGEDLDLALRLGEVGRLGNIPDVCYLYRQRLDSLSHRTTRARSDLARVVHDAHVRRGLHPPDLAPNDSDKRDSDSHYVWAWWALADGNLRTARKLAWKLLLRKPWALETWRVLYCALRGR